MENTPSYSEESQSIVYRHYRHALESLQRAEVPFLVGGTVAFSCYTGINRSTKDLDVYVRERDLAAALAAFDAAGWRTATPFPHWLAKAYTESVSLDIIFNSGNGMTPVDEAWFTHATPHDLLDLSVDLIPPEELICSKAFVQERERFDGADVLHLLRAFAGRLDWSRIFARFGPRWRVLLSHLILFGFVYPGERNAIPARVMDVLMRRLHMETTQTPDPADRRRCQGTLLSREQYLVDIEQWGYDDARLRPDGPLSAAEIKRWTEAIGE